MRLTRNWLGILAGVGALVGGAGPAAALSLDVLSYNVRGLPSPPIEDRTAQIAAIAPKLESFHNPGGNAIVGLQEVLDVGYYNTLTNPGTVSYSSKTAKANDGPSGIGDGLTLMSDFTIDSYDRVQWGTNPSFTPGCFGSLGANGSDCDTNKGFALARVTLAPGFSLDVYNLHADAGQDGDATSGSIGARQNNINELIAYIDANSDGNAVIVMGDTNSRYTRSTDIISDLITQASVTDVWVELANSGTVPGFGANLDSACPAPEGSATGGGANASGPNCEVVDKIFYRSSSDVILTAVGYEALDAEFLDGSSNPLSDPSPSRPASTSSWSRNRPPPRSSASAW